MRNLADDTLLQRALDQGMLSEAQLKAVAAEKNRHAHAAGAEVSVVDRLVAAGALTAWQLTQLRAEVFGLKAITLADREWPPHLAALVPAALARKHGLVPVALRGTVLVIAVADPLDSSGSDELCHRSGLRVEVALAAREEIEEAWTRLYESPGSLLDEIGVEQAGHDGVNPAEPVVEKAKAEWGQDREGDVPIIRLVHELIAQAVERRASDLHLEPMEKRFRVRLRIDGVLVETDRPLQPRWQAALISRVKILANISIAEKRLPQDGRIQLQHQGRTLDLRVSSLPTVHGESVVMRILDQNHVRHGLPQLGLAAEDEAVLIRLLAQPDGMVLITGPTGSGKTTTLYSCLHHLNQADRKIITVEDPVEYQLNGINQVSVEPAVGLTFGAALRAMLRQAPNVIMVGEIRDRETAEMAVNAALTGHLVFSTLHTNDAPGAVARLIDLGAKPFLLATALRAVLAQRLVRRLCVRCRQPYEPGEAERNALGLAAADAPVFMRAVGCHACGGTGYRGQLPIFEIFVTNPAIQQLIHGRVGSSRLRAQARADGMKTLREDGARKVSAGLTTVEEVVSISAGDAHLPNFPHPP